MENKNKFIFPIAAILLLAGCGEHELCERQRSAKAKIAIGISDYAKPGGTMYDLQKAERATQEAIDITKEINARNIKCK